MSTDQTAGHVIRCIDRTTQLKREDVTDIQLLYEGVQERFDTIIRLQKNSGTSFNIAYHKLFNISFD